MRMRKMVLSGLVVAAGQLAWAQSAPPIKMGLWQNTATVTTTMHLPPEMAAQMNAPGGAMAMPPRTVETKTCHTAADWEKSFANSQARNCTITNKLMTAKGMSLDLTCTEPGQGKAVAHMDAVFDSPEQVHSTMHMTFVQDSAAQHGAGTSTTMDVKSESRYLSADCGNVKPMDVQPTTNGRP